MPSSVIHRFAYKPETAELEITFTTGRRYIYSDVPKEVADEFRSAFSKGVFFNRYIRDSYSYRELDPIF
jgi:KTSC domain